MTSSIYVKTVIINSTPIPADTDILQEDIDISRDEVSPGGGGFLRIALSMDYAAANPTISVYDDGVFVGNFVEETGSNILSDSIYNFFLVAEEPDKINFRCNRVIDAVHVFRAHLLQNI